MIKFKVAVVAAGMIFAGSAASASCWISGCYAGNAYVSGPYSTTTYVRHGYVGRAYNAPTVVTPTYIAQPTYVAQPVYVAPSRVSVAYAPSGSARASYLGYTPYSTNYGSANFGRPSVTDYYAETGQNFAAGVGGLYTPGVAGYGRAPSDAEIMGGDTTFPRRAWDTYTASVPSRTYVPVAGVVVSRNAVWGSYGRVPSEPRYLDGQIAGGPVAVIPSLSPHNPRAQQVFHDMALADDSN